MTMSSRTRRRVVISLAALVDLLFVVMFLQFVELQRVGEGLEQARDSAIGSQQDAERLRQTVLDDQGKLASERDALQQEVEKLRAQLAAYEDSLKQKDADRIEVEKRAAERESQLGEAVREMLLGVDEAEIARQLAAGGDDQVASITRELRDAKGRNASQVVQSLRKTVELRKRCDIWEVHLHADGGVRVRGPEVEQAIVPVTKDGFADDFMKLTKKAAEPKSLVVILFTHENCTVGTLAMVEDGLELVRQAWSARLSAGKTIQVSQPNYTESAP